jgi:hypothetical protein
MSAARRRVVMIAFHFPPLQGSSGIQRTLRFVQHLPAFGWEPIVLTARPHAYDAVADDLLDDVPPDVTVIRALAPNTARHLAIAGRYPSFLARPDRWKLWRYFGAAAGRRALARYRPVALWSTYPIATAHAIGADLQAGSGLPWIADFRDPMAQDGYPPDRPTWESYRAIESRAVARAAHCVFVTPSALALYRSRYGEGAARRFALIENGYDEATFARVESEPGCREPLAAGCITLVHSGIVYPSERDPAALFAALGRLRREGVLVPGRFLLRFRAAVHDELLRGLAARQGVTDLIDLAPPIAYADALREMLRADGLIVMQAANCNEQIPAKLYEYLRARRPILGLADPAGDTGRALLQAGVEHVVALEDAAATAASLRRFIASIADGTVRVGDPGVVAAASRQRRTAALARLLDSTVRQAARDDAPGAVDSRYD